MPNLHIHFDILPCDFFLKIMRKIYDYTDFTAFFKLLNSKKKLVNFFLIHHLKLLFYYLFGIPTIPKT